MRHKFHLLWLLISLECSSSQKPTSPMTAATVNCSNCDSNASCEEHGDLHRCVCREGFTGDGATCFDIDECSHTDLNRCHSLAICINNQGNYSCSCPKGYKGDGYHCEATTGFAEDCVGINGSRSCVDPCLSHTVLEQSWRSMSYGSGSNCDSDKIGWYRFVGRGGTRMPETCVPKRRCNTFAPMWLNGSHPTSDTGIVNRIACANWEGACCYWSIPVQVKACVGGYYVYKLDGTPTCTLSYCTDPKYIDNPCPQCNTEEECRLENGEWGCYCSTGYPSSDISSLEPQLECGANEIKVSLEKCILNQMGIHNAVVYLRDYKCAGFEEKQNRTMISVVTHTQSGQCGTQLTKNETHATYSNTLYLADGTVTREDEIKINFHCSYPLDMEISLETAIQPIVSSVNISTGAAGVFLVKMALYRDQNYTSPYEGAKAILSTEDWLYVGVMITEGDTSQFVLQMDNCFATPTENATDPLKYYIIQNRCPNTQDSTIEVPENGVGPQGQFSLQVFKFVGNHNLVYLHCEIRLCDTSTETCKPSCSKIGSRRAAEVRVDTYSLTLGPLFQRGFPSEAGSAAASHALQGACVTVLIPATMSLFLHSFT
ncbi:uromodulin [Anolis sagrei]|uniref:uromodulin n=1 Tax=Anolis sagrei TaxID=38937 RepID=UPI003521B797